MIIGLFNRAVRFNHNLFCQILRSASDDELKNTIRDVHIEEVLRRNAEKNKYTKKIREAIKDAIDAGYIISFYQNSDRANYIIDANSVPLLDVKLE